MKLICSSSQSDIGVGTLLVLTVDPNSFLENGEDGFIVTDVDGNKFDVYDYMTIDQVTSHSGKLFDDDHERNVFHLPNGETVHN